MLLAPLDAQYPGFFEWLDRKAQEIRTRRAQANLAISPTGQLAAMVIATPKPDRRIKVSTIYVAPPFRGLGIGTHLVARILIQACADNRTSAHVTFDSSLSEQLHPFLARLRFSFVENLRGRYRPHAVETVYRAPLG